MKLISTLLFIFIFSIAVNYAQSAASDTLDPYGYVNKYDTTFSGIGPKVYILPLPRTLKEEMTDTYSEIQSFQDSIYAAFKDQRLLANFRPTSNAVAVHTLLTDSISPATMKTMIQRNIAQNNHALAYGLLNSLALNLLYEGNKKEAIEALRQALAQTQMGKAAADIAVIQSNLASVYLLTNQLDEALDLEKSALAQAIKAKNPADQAFSYSRMALIQAYSKDYFLAENTIIRKAIPLFNKSKSYSGKIDAWIALAEIYRLQNKHTEAQWFLLQARDLAHARNLQAPIATIEYMLGSSKLVQSNYRVAKEELESAWQLAQEGENQYLQLAIIEQLGRSYVYLKDYESAKSYLNQYWDLRNLLF